MEKRYISEGRYKKSTSRKRRNASTVKLNSTRQVKKVNSYNEIKKPKKKIKRIKQSKTTNIITCIILLVVIAVISRAILKEENEPFIPLPFFVASNDEIITIGVITQDSLLEENTNNIVINELNKYSKDMLLEINEDYSITYKVISNINKVSNKEYIITRNTESKVTIDSIKNAIDTYRQNKSSVYYYKLSNIDSVTIVDNNNINIKLKQDDTYFAYKLDICLKTATDKTNYIQDAGSTDGMLIFNRHKQANKELPLKVIVKKYKDMYAAVEAYKQQEINMFITNSENVTNILGKYEYNIKTYRNGQSVFLFGNVKSEIYSKAEVRQVLAYGIDRDGIIKDVLKSKGNKIDIPYVYDETKYKYDVYAAENILLTNGYKKSNNIYSKTENGKKVVLELDLIVNKEDQIKVSIANRIKNNLGAIGIKVNVEKLTQAKIKSRIKSGEYDLLLASVNLNNTPDITFVQDKMFVTEQVKQTILNVENSTVKDLGNNINSLRISLSQEVSTVGIYSDVSYLIYSKDIIGIQDVSYMNLFKDILN